MVNVSKIAGTIKTTSGQVILVFKGAVKTEVVDEFNNDIRYFLIKDDSPLGSLQINMLPNEEALQYLKEVSKQEAYLQKSKVIVWGGTSDQFKAFIRGEELL